MSIVAHYIKERTRDAQFIIISLRNNMFELADRLVGIYKTDNATKSITSASIACVYKLPLTPLRQSTRARLRWARWAHNLINRCCNNTHAVFPVHCSTVPSVRE